MSSVGKYTPPDPAADPWLTVAEFAEATRVRPVTVRSWIAKGQLKATRSGRRKWLIRRSELDRMLNEELACPRRFGPALVRAFVALENGRGRTHDEAQQAYARAGHPQVAGG